MSAALEQLHAVVREVAGVNALTGPLVEQRLDLATWFESGRWRTWRKARLAGYAPDFCAGALVLAIERLEEARLARLRGL